MTAYHDRLEAGHYIGGKKKAPQAKAAAAPEAQTVATPDNTDKKADTKPS